LLRPPSTRSLALTLVLTATVASYGRGADLPPAAAAKLAPRLVAAALDAPDDTVSAWIEFADKGEQGPGDLARRLSAAQIDLAPRARARRLRAHVRPLVDYLDLPVAPAYLAALSAQGLRPYGASRWFNRVAVRVPARRLVDLAALPFVGRLAPVESMRRSADPETSALPAAPPTRAAAIAALDYGPMLGPLDQLHLPAVHDSGYGGAGTLVCVLDEGFNFFDKHEALRDLVIPSERQRDFYRGLTTVQDTTDPGMVHGTWVLGVLGGRKFGTYVGAAFDAEFALGRTEVRNFELPEEMVYWGMGAEWADSLGADIISCSLGYTTFDNGVGSYTYQDMDGHTTIITRAAEIAASKGILVVTAAGNEGTNVWHYLTAPSDADGDSVIAVGAVDASGFPASFSSYGPSADGRIKPDLAARGVSVTTPTTSGDPTLYSVRSGTSFATPLIAGVAACLMQARPQWAPRQVIAALRGSASQRGAPDVRVGYGIPDALAALATPAPLPIARLALRSVSANPAFLDLAPTRFELQLPDRLCGRAGSIRVHDALGRRVRELWSGVLSCGALPIVWDGRDDESRAVPPGLYLVDVRVGGEHATLRLVGLR